MGDIDNRYGDMEVRIVGLDDLQDLHGLNFTRDGRVKVSMESVAVVPKKYYPRMYLSDTENSISSSGERIVNLPFTGKLDKIDLQFSRREVYVSIWVDGVEIFEEQLKYLDDSKRYNLDDYYVCSPPGLSVRSDGRHLTWNMVGSPVDVNSGIEIYARRASSSVKLDGVAIQYRVGD